jgi:AraC family transcriptional regulator, L-rhamnose operon transcriptional activator RhaR
MSEESYPVLKGHTLFRSHELVYLNRSDELKEYCEIMHKHDFIEIAYVVSGRGNHRVGDYSYEVAKGDLIVINYNVPHGFFTFPDAHDGPTLYNCVFMPEFLDTTLFSGKNFKDITSSFLFESLFPEDFSPGPDLRLQGTDFYEIGELFSKMYQEYKLTKKGYSDIIRAYLIELIVKIFRLIESKGQKSVPLHHQELVNKAVEYLKQNYNSEIKLEDLALKSFISKNYFSRLFKEVTGISFSDYIQKIRINEACNLIKNSDQKVVDIAFQVGFKDLKFFYEVFKKITGKTPGEYRN